MSSAPKAPKRNSFLKRFFGQDVIRVLVVASMRLFRWFGFGSVLLRHDPRLLALLRSDDPALFGVWHQDFHNTLGYLSRWNARRRTYPLASASRDGTMAAVVAEGMGFRKPVRGSSARGGHRALLALTRLLKTEPDASVAVVVDGPRPPARLLKPGLIHLAQVSGRPIWLVRSSWSHTIVLKKTWAKFHIGIPGSRGVILADGPIHVPANMDRAGLEAIRLDCEQRLNALAERADRAVGLDPARSL
jgi:lysophospholipid acyltransferase (LPLAT)-like uncharacterized protein